MRTELGVPMRTSRIVNATAARWDGRRATPENLADRFWRKVDRRDARECWPWLGGRGGRKAQLYGIFRNADGQHTSAHRIAYELGVGPIPHGLVLDHTCEHTLCVNPAHLEPVTAQENRRRQSARQTHCKRDHPLAGDNLYVDRRGFRACVICRRETHTRTQRARRAKARSAA